MYEFNENDLNNIIPPPSQIDAQKMVDEIRDNIHRRPPNGFMIYRKVCCKTLKKHGKKVRGNISKPIANSWRNLPKPIKDEYKNKADEVNELLIKKRKHNFTDSHRSIYCSRSFDFRPDFPYFGSEDEEDRYLKLILPHHEFEEFVVNRNFRKFINHED
ncbi:1218_t:CDS:1 [Diversispora eburnea]|uniref:1218_t:CDS:1 n=1 Tax=Diversispora eburnea TaxID=1213867 RepID=A0A9N8Z4H4_9GLOM|nr:1218_t:CDS:1 [Diversispora eburnea]